MSDVTDLFEGKLTPLQFIAKEWANAGKLVAQLPAEVQPLGQTLLTDAENVLSAAEEWTGTAVSAYLAANGGALTTEILNLLSGLGLSGSALSAASQDTLTAAFKLLQALVAHAVVDFQQANAPTAVVVTPPPPAPAPTETESPS